ncbi:hypothetical protein RBB50_012669 [Rhinocladiella similis]
MYMICHETQPTSPTAISAIGLTALFLTIAGLINDRYIRLRKADNARILLERPRMGLFAVPELPYLDVLFGKSVTPPLLPTFEGLLVLAELGLWTSGTLHRILTNPMRFGWTQLYEEIVVELACLPTEALRAIHKVWPEAESYVGKVRAQPDRTKAAILRSELYRHNVQKPDRLVRMLRPYSIDVTGIDPNLNLQENSVNELEQYQVFALNSLDDLAIPNLQPVWMLSETSPCIQLSSYELLTLSYSIALPLSVNDFTQRVRGLSGGFCSSLNIFRPSFSSWDQVHLDIGSSHPANRPMCTTGYTMLNAKAIACGNLIFATKRFWYQSIFVNSVVLRAIKEGRAIHDISGPGGKAMLTLWSLPGAKQVAAYFHADEEWDINRVGGIYSSATGKHIILEDRQTGRFKASIPHCVTLLAFGGGLVPQASKSLVEAVSFIVFDTQTSSSYITQLEYLLNEICNLWHRECADAESGASIVETVFGREINDRVIAADFLEYDCYTQPKRLTVADGTIVFHRYSLLLEALAARIRLTGQEAGNIGVDVPKKPAGMDNEALLNMAFGVSEGHITACYHTAVKAHLSNLPSVNVLAQSVAPIFSDASPDDALPDIDRLDLTFHNEQADRAVTPCHSELEDHGSAPPEVKLPPHFVASLPDYASLNIDALDATLQGIRDNLTTESGITLTDFAVVVRAVIAAWAAQVALVEWSDEVDPSAQEDSTALPKVRRSAEIGDLPAICGLD